MDTRRRVLLVDGNMRRPTVHKFFGTSLTPGLCDAIQSNQSSNEFIIEISDYPLSILPAGIAKGTPVELLADDRFGRRIAALKESFDIIIVDTPCVSQHQDFEFMGKMLDGTVLAVESDTTQLPLLLDIKHRIETSGAPIVGVTLTRTKKSRLSFMNRLMGLD